MNNNERQAGTNAQQSTNAELTTSAPLAANPMLGVVKSFYVCDYYNTKEHRESYGVVINFGRKKSEKKRLPLFFLDEKIAVSFVDDLKPLIGKSESELKENKLLDSLIDKYKVKALNYKPNQVV